MDEFEGLSVRIAMGNELRQTFSESQVRAFYSL